MYLWSKFTGAFMVAGPITNFDTYVWISVGLFVVGLIGAMVYERSSGKGRRQPPKNQKQQSRSGTNTDIET